MSIALTNNSKWGKWNKGMDRDRHDKKAKDVYKEKRNQRRGLNMQDP